MDPPESPPQYIAGSIYSGTYHVFDPDTPLNLSAS